jgi:mono/diheme cytochrome c family protein
LTVITKGLSGRIDVNGQVFIGNMPSFSGQLDDASVALIATHVRHLHGTSMQASPYTSEEVSAVRQSTGSPPQTRQIRQTLLGTR